MVSPRDLDPTAAAVVPAAGRGFRPASRRRVRIATGVALAAAAVGGNVLVYTSLDDATEVVQLVANVRAGERVTSADVRLVSTELDPTVPHIGGDSLGSVVGQYAVTFIPSGTLVTRQLLQARPLVAAGTGVVAVRVGGGGLPTGVTERSRVRLVFTDGGSNRSVDGRVVWRNGDGDISGEELSVEVPVGDADAVAAADDVRLVLLEGDRDPAVATGAHLDAPAAGA